MSDCDRARYHDNRHVPDAVARTESRPPGTCICGKPDRHVEAVVEDICYDCLVNRLRYWRRFYFLEALPGHEADVESADRKAREVA